MYSNRYEYNNTRAGPSRASFSQDSFSYYNDYNNYRNLNVRAGPPERVNQNRPFPNQQQNVMQERLRDVPYQNRRNNNQKAPNMQQDRKRDFAPSTPHRENRNQNYHRKNQDKHPDIRLRAESQNVKKKSPKTLGFNNALYVCPGCSSPFDCLSRCNQYVGRVPLMLNCRHTVCQECISKLVSNNSVVCPVCTNPSVIPHSSHIDNIQETFWPNFHLLGFILWSKSLGNDVNHLMLVPAEKSTGNIQVLEAKQEPGEVCCFLSCNRTASLRCQDCNDVYCMDCCTIVHKSAKSLWTHKQSPIQTQKLTLELEKCGEHNMDVEFFCKTCESGACCYCFLEKHEGHDKDHLTKLSDLEMDRLKSRKEQATRILKQLIISQTRLKNLDNFSTSEVEKEIANNFLNYYAKLFFIDKNLRKEISSCQTNIRSAKGMENINSRLDSSIETLKNILSACDGMDEKKLNLKEVLNLLDNVSGTPCYLISDNNKGLKPVVLEVHPLAENFEEYFKIKENNESQYSLVAEEDLPPDYQKDMTELQMESDAESVMSSMIKSVRTEELLHNKKKTPHSSKQSIGKSNQLGIHLNIQTDIEKVDVTHIESLECFYVQLKKTQFRFLQMNQDIENYIKMGAATVDQPQLNELYLAMYVTNQEKIWCRGRVVEIKNGESEPLYEVFFIDYGSTQTLDITKLREITPAIASRKAYAIQCELQNPTYVNWSKNAHVYMGKMINGKDVFMSVKCINSGIHLVDLMVSSSDGGLTSIIDILIHTCINALSNSSDNESVSSQKFSFTPVLKIFTNSMKFTKNQIENVIIANVIDPHHIFVHVAGHAESLKKMGGILKNHYKNSPKNTCIPVEGSYVVVEHKDPIRGNWHRALIKKVDMHADKAHVMLVDWGLNIVVPLSAVRMLTESFTKLESQAVLVKMAHIEPFEKGQAWPELATVFLQKYFRMQDVLKMIVNSVEPLEVALFEILGDVDVCINAQLVVENFAVSTGKISQTIEWLRNEAKVKGFTEDEGLVEALLKKVDESDIEEESEEEDKDKSVKKSKINVVKFVSPCLIYIKFSMYEEQEHELHKELQVHYSKERKMKESWDAGQDCVVLYLNNYARAKILAEEGDNKYRVNIYDKPAEVVLPLTKIFEYVKYFSKYHNVVFKSHLANIRPAGGDTWSLSSTEALERVFDRRKDIYGAKVEGDTSGKSLPMLMWYTQVKIGGALEASLTKFISINDKLVKLGFAYKQQPKEIMMLSARNVATSDSDSSVTNKDPQALLSVIEKLANQSSSSVDSCTDKESSDMESKEKSSHSSSKGSSSNNWVDLVEEEELKEKEDKQESPYHTKEAEIEDWIPAFPIEKREFSAWVTCAENEGYLYLRDHALQRVYQEMENNIKQYFDNQPPNLDIHEWQVGQLCTIAYKESWFRGKVYKVNSSDDIVAVMIDFGSDHNLKAHELNREIMFPEIPAFATKIKLDRVFAKSGTWLSSDYEKLMEIVSENAKVIIKGPLDVDVPMAEVFTDKGVNVNQTLVQCCPNLTRCETVDSDDSEEDGVVIEEEAIVGIEELEGNEVKVREIEEMVEKTTPFDTTGFKFKVKSLPEMALTENTLMSIMAVLSYNKVVLKAASETLADELILLGCEIQETIDNQPVLAKFDVGTPCVCPYTEDGNWYRAEIYNTDKIDCSFVYVFFVDYGNVELVSTKDVKMMRPKWFELPVLCHVAELNIKLKDDGHAQLVLEHMKKLYGKHKLGRIVVGDPLTVNLYESDGSLCYQMLLDSGLLIKE